MSNVSQADFDFWDFVACARCQLPFIAVPGVPPQIPFWLTECGHVICNSHLNTDQSCAQCGAQSIQLVPLQRDLDPPMSDWFRSLPHSFDGIANAAKFQQESMALQIRYYRGKHQQYRSLVDRMKSEVAENKALRKAVEELGRENEELRQHLGYYPASDQHDQGGKHQGKSHLLNSNGKRQRMDLQQNSNDIRAGTSSSPRSIVTPLGPNRLTIPPGQQPPNLSTPQDSGEGGNSYSNPSWNASTSIPQIQQRPGSSRFIEQYTYTTPQTPQFHPSKLSLMQAAPRQFQRTTPSQKQVQSRQAMMPPPPPSASRFKPAQRQAFPISGDQGSRQLNQNIQKDRERREMGMGLPGMPQQPQHQPLSFDATTQQGTHQRTQGSTTSFPDATELQSNTTLKSSQRPVIVPPSSMTHANQRFAFPVPGSGAIQRFAPSTSAAPRRFTAGVASGSGPRAPSRAMNMESGGQRVPFVPGAHGFE